MPVSVSWTYDGRGDKLCLAKSTDLNLDYSPKEYNFWLYSGSNDDFIYGSFKDLAAIVDTIRALNSEVAAKAELENVIND